MNPGTKNLGTLSCFGLLVRDLERGKVMKTNTISQRFGVSQRTAQRWLKAIDEDVVALHRNEYGVWFKR